MEYQVIEKYLIHDGLFSSYENAKKYDDGKDSPTKVFVTMDQSDMKSFTEGETCNYYLYNNEDDAAFAIENAY